MQTLPLTNQTLSDLHNVEVPNYDRSQITAGIVHIGVGNFHRAHQAWYLHRLMQQGEALDWGIVGAGVRPADAQMRERLQAQDWMTTLIELDPQSSGVEVVGSMMDFVPIEPENQALIRRMSAQDIRIVALTVTEGGYYVDPASGRLDIGHPDLQHDIENIGRPRTAFGAIVAALSLRRANGLPGFTGLSCDNLQGNGQILRQAIIGLADAIDPALAEWISENCSFPNSMVDCIVPATGPREIQMAESLGIQDLAPVTHESFRQWVIEDDFVQGRPAWEKVGATFTDAVHDYERMKIGILNGGHQVVSVPGELFGLNTIADCLEHPKIAALFRRIATYEVAPQIPSVPGMTPQAYVELIERRFANPKIVDTVRRVAFDGSSRHPGFILPAIRGGLAGGSPIQGLALIEAAWARMCLGVRENGSKIEPNDPYWPALQSCAMAADARPRAWVEQAHIYGDLIESAEFVAAFEDAYLRIQSSGLAAAIEAYLDDAAAA